MSNSTLYEHSLKGITAPEGFLATGVHAGIKADGLDMALIFSVKVATMAGTFTTNRVAAAPVVFCREQLKGRVGQAIVINSGVANACTGTTGFKNVELTAQIAAETLGISVNLVYVCSTGVIGKQLPMQAIENGIKIAGRQLSKEGGSLAARAIMTTDTQPKESVVEIKVGGKKVTIGGMCKGAGMIEPNMATMLAFITTDADVPKEDLQKALSSAVNESFNRISVDGCQSTNDTVLMMANGMAGADKLYEGHPDWKKFVEGLNELTRDLALKIVADGEGATKLVTIRVVGAVSNDDARKICRAIANSLLVKTSWYGGDPNWGRVMSAIGASGAYVLPEMVCIRYNDSNIVTNGVETDESSRAKLARIISQREFCITVDLHLGGGEDVIYTCDCSEEYVRINSEYST
jgi:glutamate N-acetyltransferase/amino-acid N-acetyltransferase